MADETRHRRLAVIADDNDDVRDSLAMLMEAFGFEVACARNGLVAVELARTLIPNVVLLDIGMPVMDGFEAGKRMRQEPHLAHVLLAAVTGYGDDRARERTREIGFDAHFTKPLDIDALQRLLEST